MDAAVRRRSAAFAYPIPFPGVSLASRFAAIASCARRSSNAFTARGQRVCNPSEVFAVAGDKTRHISSLVNNESMSATQRCKREAAEATRARHRKFAAKVFHYFGPSGGFDG
jgi:hypothetical protein